VKPTIDTPRPIRDGEELDTAALEMYLRRHESGPAESLTIEQFPHGHSNLTYLLRWGESEYVLRRPPFGNQVKSAHDMGREFRVLSRLATVYPPAPAAVLYCDDLSVLGAPFYLMERRHGVVLRRMSQAQYTLTPATARRLDEALIDNLARLHTLDYEAAGLGDLGKPDGYVARQVNGWTNRYRQAETEALADMETAARWLAGHQPRERGAALIHNDYKFDNLLLDPEDLTRIVAVLDWEMATIGDPLMDLGSTLAYWVEATDPPELQAFVVGPSMVEGSMTRAELVERYQANTGFDVGDLRFYYCFGLFKTAVILQQIYARYVRGHTQDARFAQLNGVVKNLAAGAARALAD
jgi:aminoglycoside phosphotransferase (APT) family kinase protein